MNGKGEVYLASWESLALNLGMEGFEGQEQSLCYVLWKGETSLHPTAFFN